MFGQCDACLFLIILQGGVEKRLEASRFWLLSHLEDREEMGSSGGGVGSLGEKMMARRESVGRRWAEGWHDGQVRRHYHH
jgi:hypothetical protein